MSSQQNIRIVTALLCILSVSLVAVQANNTTLINQLCGVTSAPVACTRCIYSRPAPTNSEQDVVLGLLTCAYVELLTLEIAAKDAMDDLSTDQTTREALDLCNPLILNLISYNGILDIRVGKKEYALAKSGIDEVVNNEISGCNRVLSGPGVTFPPKMFSGLISVMSDYGIISQVLSVIH